MEAEDSSDIDKSFSWQDDTEHSSQAVEPEPTQTWMIVTFTDVFMDLDFIKKCLLQEVRVGWQKI